MGARKLSYHVPSIRSYNELSLKKITLFSKVDTGIFSVFYPKNRYDYSPFGMLLPNRHSSSNEYRYGFNGMEKDDEVSGEGNIYDYGFRIYNPRLGKFLSMDPIASSFPWFTPYQFAGNKPIIAIDLDGKEEYFIIRYVSNGKLLGMAFVQVTRDSYLQSKKIEHAKLVSDVNAANAHNQGELGNLKKKEKTKRAEIQGMIDKNNQDVIDSQNELTALEKQVDENFSKVVVEEYEVTEDGTTYNGFSTLRAKKNEIVMNPTAYSKGKELSDNMKLTDQNILNIGAPACDIIFKTEFTAGFASGNGYLGINVPQSMQINFEPNKFILPSDLSNTLDNLYIAMILIPDMKITLIGHTDSDGSEGANIKLSENRANAAKGYLESLGIDGSRIETKGAGESEPVGDNNTKEGKASNRRIEIKQN